MLQLYLIPLIFALIGLAFYAVLGGADFGAGFWQLTAGKGRIDGCRMRGVVPGVEIDLGDRTAEPAQLGRGRRTPLGRPGGQHHAQAPATGVAPGQGQCDVGGPAQQQQRLGRA